MDLSGHKIEAGLIPYMDGEVVDISATDHTFVYSPARALLITASGNVTMQLQDRGTNLTIPVVVTAGNYILLEKFYITKIIKVTTTATVAYGLY
jgi:hypothetical protein